MYLDETIYQLWIESAAYGNIGLCGGLIVTAAITKLIFFPLQFYG
jgi:hypothetical protein